MDWGFQFLQVKNDGFVCLGVLADRPATDVQWYPDVVSWSATDTYYIADSY